MKDFLVLELSIHNDDLIRAVGYELSGEFGCLIFIVVMLLLIAGEFTPLFFEDIGK
ncbi:hypothetical protein [Vibrio sp. 11986-1-5]|uniref:hypothetical protein n=1 Tax=Vibrio sp. 11986-1-5 TaxID=2211215 RepID=UPI0015E82BF0|nr:hypothetical protein [Vibrio sp. 11986-1-5]